MFAASFYEDRARGKKQAHAMAKIEPEKITVDTWLGGYRYLFPDTRTDRTAYNEYTRLSQFRAAYARRPLSSITAIEAQAWTLEHPGQVRFLRHAWDRAVQMRVAPINVWLLVVKPARTKPKVRAPTDEELERILAACMQRAGEVRGPWWGSFYNMIEVAAFCGARQAGLAGLRAMDVDLDAHRMAVTEKGNKTRTLVLVGRAHEAMARQFVLREHEGWRAPEVSARKFPAKEGEAPTQGRPRLMWVGPTLRPMNRGRAEPVEVAWRKIRGDFPHGFHSLKHYATSWMRRQGVSALDVAVQVGHIDEQGRPYADLVDRVYDHPDPAVALARVEETLR